MKQKIKLIVISCLILLLSCSVFTRNSHNSQVLSKEGSNNLNILQEFRLEEYNFSSKDSSPKFDNLSPELIQEQKKSKELEEEPKAIKGIYLTGWVAGSPTRFNKIFNLIQKTELNALVIDVKNIEGEISYNSQISLAQKMKASVNKIKNIRDLLKRCRDNDIYTIARIPVFKDWKLATDPLYSLKFYDEGAEQTKILSNQQWVNPYSRQVWKYNVDLAIEAAAKGFDEIQFDYIRFPTFLNRSRYKLAVAPTDSKIAIINDFVSYTKSRLNKYEIPFSVDVFGMTTSADDLGIGQNFESLVKKVDYISPMIYPSHYSKGVYGLKLPEKAPYSTVYNSMQHAKERLNGKTAKLRPWLQDFTLKYRYGPREIEEQIQAAKELGLDSWLLWNPGSNYTWQVFMQNEVEGDRGVRTDGRKSNAPEDESSERFIDRT